MFHKPLVRSRKPVIMNRFCFNIFTSNLVKMATQSSLQSCLVDMSKPVVMLLKTWADCALEDSLLESCRVALKYGLFYIGDLNCWAVRGVGNVGAVWQGIGMEVVGSGRGIGYCL